MASTSASAHEGYLKLCKKKDAAKDKNFTTYYGQLSGGALFYYKHAQDAKEKGVLTVHGATIGDATNEHGFSLASTKDGEYVVCGVDAGEAKEWRAAIEQATAIAPGPRPDKEKQRKGSAAAGLKKSVAGKAATSGKGKEMLRKKMSAEMNALLDHFLEMITKAGGGKKRADELFDTLIKLMVKVVLQLDEGLEQRKLNPSLLALRDGFEALDELHRSPSAAAQDKASAAIKKVEAAIVALVKNFVKPDNVVLFKSFFDYIASPAFLKDVWQADACKKEATEVADVMRRYAVWEDTFENCVPVRKTLNGLLIDDGGLEIDDCNVYRDEKDYLKQRAAKGTG